MAGNGRSIRVRLLFPLLLIMLLQSILFFAMICYGGIAETLKKNAIDILNDNTENSKLTLEQELYRWMQVVKEDNGIADGIDRVIEAEGQTPSDIRYDTKLNKEILDNMTQRLIDLLHRSYATGAFLTLNGPAAENSPDSTLAGIYIRDLEPNSFASDNSDLLLERGLPSISKKYGIPLDSYWQMGFDIREDKETSPYYHKPFDSAVQNHAQQGEEANFSYLGLPMKLNVHDDKEVVTYSMPVILSDGTVVGVAGVDMAASELQDLISTQRLASTDKGICVLGVRQKGEQSIRLVTSGGSLYQSFFGGRKEISYEENKHENAFMITAEDGAAWYGSVHQLSIYNANTPFEQEEWVLLGMIPRNDSLQIYEQIRSMLAISLVVTLLLSVIGVFITGKVVTDPISRLIVDLRSQKDTSHLSMMKVHINEIDELTSAIEKLSADVAESASKISRILDHANVLVGVYEYKENEGSVFCSRSLFELLRWDDPGTSYIYLDKSMFLTKMKRYFDVESCEDGVCKVPGEPERWVRLISVREGSSQVLGVLTDVTHDVLERQKLERERNYDSLTNIYNRRAFREEAVRLLGQGDLGTAAVIMWDLDNLKYINDTYGHDEGDHYIAMFARSLRRLEKEGGVVARYSGDEFASILYGAGKEEIRQRLKDFMIHLQTRMIEIEMDYQIPIRVSAGLAWYPSDAKNFDELMSFADFAMYTVKHSVKGMIMEFDRDEYDSRSYMLSGREELNNLLESRNTTFAFQPIVTDDGEIYGYELLMRPQLKKLKGITEVLNLAREQAKLNQMESLTWFSGLKAIGECCQRGEVGDKEKFFVNSIASAVLSEADIKLLEERYHDYLDRIVVEMTEGEPIAQGCLDRKLKAVKSWKAMIAIDDFGAGYNSESVLLRIAPDIVKIDRNLVQNIDKDRNRQVLLENLMIYTKRLGIKILGEGVETQEELETLLGYGVELFQGFYIARPQMENRPIEPYIAEKMRSLKAGQSFLK